MPRAWIQDRLRVVLVQRDARMRGLLARALEAEGHSVVALPCGAWLAPLLAGRPLPDAVVIDAGAAGKDRALDALDDLDVAIPVVASPPPDEPRAAPGADGETARRLLRDLDAATGRR